MIFATPCAAPEVAGLQSHRGRDARARHRAEHGDFQLDQRFFLRGLPFKEPERVVHMYSNARERNLSRTRDLGAAFQHYRDGQTIFDGFGAENVFGFTLTGLGDPVQIFGGKVTANYFDVLGVRPIRGRNFLPEEEESADVAMVTENFWQKRLGGDPNVIGRSITLDGVPHTIVGVLPNLPFSWVGPSAEVWTTKPFTFLGLSHERMMRGSGFLRVVGRLKPGMTLEQARAALPSLEQSYRTQYPDKIDSSSVMTLKTLPEDVTGNLRPAFTTLARGRGICLADRMQQCRESTCSLGSAGGGAKSHYEWRLARRAQRGATVRVRKLARQCVRRNRRRVAGVALRSVRAENGGEFSAVRTRDARPAFASACSASRLSCRFSPAW